MGSDARVTQRSIGRINYGVCDADACLVIEHGGESVLQSTHDLGGRIIRLSVSHDPRRQKAFGEGYRKGRTEPLAASFSDQYSNFAPLQFEHVVKIAADFMRGMATGRDGEIGKLRQSFRHQSLLGFTR